MPIFGLFGPPNVEKLKTRHNVNGLIKALGYEQDWEVRKAAANALGEIGDTRAVEPLLDTLKDGSAQGAIIALRKIGIPAVLGQTGGTRAIETLIALLPVTDITWGDMYDSVYAALVKIGTPAVVPLIAALKDENELRRKRAIQALADIGDERAIEPLIELLESEDPSVGGSAAAALYRLGWRPENDTEKVHYFIKIRNWDELKRLGELAVGPLIQAVRASNDGLVREFAIRTLGDMKDERTIEPLIQALKDHSSGIKIAAGRALGEIGNSGAVEALIRALEDEDRGVREEAACALGKIGDRRAVEPLLRAMEVAEYRVQQIPRIHFGSDAEFDEIQEARGRQLAVLMEIAKALGELRDERAVQPLARVLALKDLDHQRISHALITIGEPTVVGLIRTLMDGDSSDRIMAARALGWVRDKRAVEPLIQALEDENSDVRKSAKWALEKIQTK